MSYFRVDDGFTSNAKIASLSDREFRVFMRILCYCAKNRDPSVDHATFSEVVGLNQRVFNRLLELELIEAVDETQQNHEVHDWAKYQPKDASNAERQERFRDRRNARRNGKVTDEPVTETLPHAQTHAVASPVQSIDQEPSVLPTELQYADDDPDPDFEERQEGRQNFYDQHRLDPADELARTIAAARAEAGLE